MLKGRTHGSVGTYTAGCRCRLCRAANRIYARKMYRKHPEAAKIRAFRGRLKWLYGLSVKDYDKLMKAQNSVCAICGKPCGTGRRLAVDHNHKTKENRALLCFSCNSKLGWYEKYSGEINDYLIFHAR